MEEIKLYVLGSCIGAVLYQRRVVPLHGSGINVNGKGILLTGEPGAGKSTVAAVLYKRGYNILADDVTAIIFDALKEPLINPSYPYQKLWEDAIVRIGIMDEKKALYQISNGLYKFSVRSGADFDDNPIPIRTIFEIIPSDVENIIFEEVKGAGKFNVVMKNTYRKLLAEAMELREWHFSQCVNIANMIDVYRIVRPRDKHMENEIADLIMEKIL